MPESTFAETIADQAARFQRFAVWHKPDEIPDSFPVNIEFCAAGVVGGLDVFCNREDSLTEFHETLLNMSVECIAWRYFNPPMFKKGGK